MLRQTPWTVKVQERLDPEIAMVQKLRFHAKAQRVNATIIVYAVHVVA